MKSKKIANIVFYKFYGEDGARRQACIFYNDGTVQNCSYEDGIDALLELAKQENITSKEQLEQMINNELVHVMSGNDFEKQFQKFIVKEENKDNSKNELVEIPVSVEAEKENETDITDENKPTYKDLAETDYEEEEEDEKENHTSPSVVVPFVPSKNQNNSVNDDRKKEEAKKSGLKAANEVNTRNGRKKKGFFNKVKNFFHRTKVRIGAAILAVVLAFTGGAALNKNNKIGKFLNNAVTKLNPVKPNTDEKLVYGNNDYYDNYTYNQLQEVNTNQAQKSAMQKIYDALLGFNVNFANKHIEAGKDVKAALSFTEVNALHQAYNNYSNEEILAIFNGTRVNAHEFSQAYRNANLQLMGAHVIETRDAAVDMSGLINSEEGKEFYNRYHEMFLQIKEASGQDKIDKINAWRQSLLEDFPISEDVREVGIAHADNRYVAPYKASIVPMVSAVEIMYQNLAYDNTLSDKIINYFNDVGVCNIVDDTFERVERLTEIAPENNEEPLYIQYENAMVSELEALGSYVIDDEHRELTKLDAFQNAVNAHNHNGIEEQSSYTSGAAAESYTTVDTHTVTDTKIDKKVEKTKTSDREEAVKKSSEEKVKEAEEKVDKAIEKENESAKVTAEQKAEEKRQELQQEANEQAKVIEDKIVQDDKDLQQDIDKANDQINQNNSDTNTSNDKPVNEKDFGDHNVDFDDNYSDSNGNLDNSVKDLTTDSTGDKTNQPLPDPNATGEAFESTYPESTGDPFEPVPETSAPVESQDKVVVPDNTSDQADSIIEYEEPVEETIDYVDYSAISNEELADMIVESMAEVPTEDVEAYQYVIR